MILDLLPYKAPKFARKKIGWIRYIVFLLSLLFVSALFIFKVDNIENIMFWSFIIGNCIYYFIGIVLAFIFKDNRAFCKYICPITVFLKPASYFSYLRIKCDHSKCINCKKCLKTCPMNVDMLDNSRGNHVGPTGKSRGPHGEITWAPGEITWAPRGNHVGPTGIIWLKTAYAMNLCDWSSDVCSSDLGPQGEITWAPRGNHLGPTGKSREPPGEIT